MRVILPPSETKRSGGGSVFSPSRLSFDKELGEARATVRKALEQVSQEEDTAIKALRLGVKSRSERLHNLNLANSGTLPAIDRYTGVLYDALDASSLDAASRSWLEEHVYVQSALFGVINAADHIPAYRLSASSRLTALGTPLASFWSHVHSELDWHQNDWVLDLRSQDYVALAPLQGENSSYLHVMQQSIDGSIRALNHFNKAAKGELTRMLAQSQPRIQNATEFCNWGSQQGLNLLLEEQSGAITLVLNEIAS